MKSSLWGIVIAFSIIVIDQLSKMWVFRNLTLNHSYSVIGKYVRFTYVRNPNSVFGISLGAHFPYVIFSVTVCLLILFLIFREKRLKFIITYGLILGGAIGNSIDRLRWGEVVDFIDVGISNSLRWAVFNVADSAVTVSLFLLVFFIWKDVGRHHLKEGLK